MVDLIAANIENEFQQKLKALLDKTHSQSSNDEVTSRFTPLNEDDCCNAPCVNGGVL